MKRLNRTFLFLLSVLVIALIFGMFKEFGYAVTVGSMTSEFPTIILDAGHGGFDGGAVAADGTVEKDINLAITLKARDLLICSGFNVILTRETDTATDYSEYLQIKDRKVADMKNRLKLMTSNENSIFISIHLNKFASSSAFGAQVFYSPNYDESKLLADKIQSNIVNLLQPENTRTTKQGTKNTYLLYYAESPAVIVECGFLSNSYELELLKNSSYQNKIAFAIVGGILSYYS